MVNDPPANASDTGSIPGLEGSLEEEVATHCSILAGKYHGRGAWWATVLGAAKSQTPLSTHSGISVKYCYKRSIR